MKIVNQVLTKVYDNDLDETGTLTIPEGVTIIGSSVCKNLINLKSLKMPDSVTRILDNAFSNCKNLETIELSRNLTVIGREAFNDCYSLKRIEIPDSVTTIEAYAFGSCDSLEEVKLSKELKEIAPFLFDHCESLKRIEIGEKVQKIGSFAFNICPNLESVTLPESLEEIEMYAFSGCKRLKNINFPEDLKSIGDSSFSGCNSLKFIKLNENLETIDISAFSWCINLERLHLPSKLKFMDVESFGSCNKIKEISTIWGTEILKESSPRQILITYLYLYANHLLKEKYQNIDSFLENPSIESLYKENLENLFSKTTVEKFKNLYHILRKTYDIDSDLFNHLKVETTEKLSYSVWNDIKNLIPWRKYPIVSYAFTEMMEVFGIFHKDKKRFQRIEQLKKIFQEETIVLTGESYKELLRQIPYLRKKIEAAFQEEKKKYYIFTNKEPMREEFEVYLRFHMDEDEIRKVKNLSGTYGKKINAFLKRNYIEVTEIVYVLDRRKIKDKQIEEALFQTDLPGYMNYHNLNRIFSPSKQEYNEDFYNFLIDNLRIILDNDILQIQICSIRDFFPNMKNHYLYQAGSKKISIKQALNYIDSETFDYHRGCYELQKEAQKAGIIEQEKFDYYQSMYEKITREKRSLIPRSNIYEIDGYTIKVELLRKDDPFSLFVGETNYTSCCQVYDGIGHNCMNHAICSPDGGIFVIRLLKDGNWILLTESWDWQHNNVYCHDNIETTEFFKKSREKLKEAVSKVLIEDANFIIERSNQEVDRYIETEIKKQEKLPQKLKNQRLSDLQNLKERLKIKIVTVGTGNNVLDLDKYFSKSIDVDEELFIGGRVYRLQNFQPVNYNESKPYFNNNHSAYSDAKTTQYIISGDLENIVLEDNELEPIYRDERRIIKEEQNEIRDYTVSKISKMEKEAYPESMLEHQDFVLKEYQEDNTIYLGEDWYLIYQNKENGNIYISDLARIEPTLEDERGVQLQEIFSTLSNLINSSNLVEADLKENTSYLLYLLNKSLGYIEQIGEDVKYPYNDSKNKTVISEEEQIEILKNKDKIKQEKDNTSIHKVLFKKKKN